MRHFIGKLCEWAKINFSYMSFFFYSPPKIPQVLYSRIAIALWKSSHGFERHIAMQNTSSTSTSNHMMQRSCSTKYEKRAVGATESQVIDNWKRLKLFYIFFYKQIQSLHRINFIFHNFKLNKIICFNCCDFW